MAALDLITVASTDAFAARVTMFLMRACVDVANEDAATDNHANRAAFAYRMFRGEVNTKIAAMAVIASNATIQATINADPGQMGANVPDDAVQFATNGLVNYLANAFAAGPAP